MWKYFIVGYQNAQMFLFKLFPCDGSLSSHLLYWYLLALKRDFIVLYCFILKYVIDGWGVCRWQYHNIYHLVQELGIVSAIPIFPRYSPCLALSVALASMIAFYRDRLK
jgi:hypothetical protein